MTSEYQFRKEEKTTYISTVQGPNIMSDAVLYQYKTEAGSELVY